MRLPPYAGPVEVGRPFPAFEARRADGKPFSQDDWQGTVRWIDRSPSVVARLSPDDV